MQQRCCESEAQGSKSQHSRTWNHSVCQSFLSAGLGLLFFCPFFGVSSNHRAHGIFTTPDTNLRPPQAHNTRIQQTILILFLDLFDPGSQHLLFNCVPSTRQPPPTIQLITRIYTWRALVLPVGKAFGGGSAWRKEISIGCISDPWGLDGIICAEHEAWVMRLVCLKRCERGTSMAGTRRTPVALP